MSRLFADQSLQFFLARPYPSARPWPDPSGAILIVASSIISPVFGIRHRAAALLVIELHDPAGLIDLLGRRRVAGVGDFAPAADESPRSRPSRDLPAPRSSRGAALSARRRARAYRSLRNQPHDKRCRSRASRRPSPPPRRPAWSSGSCWFWFSTISRMPRLAAKSAIPKTSPAHPIRRGRDLVSLDQRVRSFDQRFDLDACISIRRASRDRRAASTTSSISSGPRVFGSMIPWKRLGAPSIIASMSPLKKLRMDVVGADRSRPSCRSRAW